MSRKVSHAVAQPIPADDVRLAIWHERLTVGHPLPTLPLWLRGGRWLQLDLEASYERTCREQKLPAVAS